MRHINRIIHFLKGVITALFSRIAWLLNLCRQWFRRVFFQMKFFRAESKQFLKSNAKGDNVFKRIFRGINGYHSKNKGIIVKTDLSKRNFTLVAYGFFNNLLKRIITQTIPFKKRIDFKVELVKKPDPNLITKTISFKKNVSIKEKRIQIDYSTNKKYLVSNSIFNNCGIDIILDKVSSIDNEMELIKLKSEI